MTVAVGLPRGLEPLLGPLESLPRTLLAAALPVLRERWGDEAEITQRDERAVAEVEGLK